jgi:hypothetical protein
MRRGIRPPFLVTMPQIVFRNVAADLEIAITRHPNVGDHIDAREIDAFGERLTL